MFALINNHTFFIAFTPKQFDYILSRVVLFSMYMGLASLGFTLIDSIITSAYFAKGTRDKIITMIMTIFYIIAVCCIFTLSLVSILGSFKRA